MKQFLLLVLLLKPIMAKAAEPGTSRQLNITQIFLNNEVVFAYLHTCTDYLASLKEKPFFMANAQLTVIELVKELKKAKPEVSEEDLGKMVLKKREKISAAETALMKQKGCESKAALEAKDFFVHMGDTPPNQFMVMLSEIK